MPRLYDVNALPGYDPEIGLLLAALEDSTREWRESLGRPSVEAIVWQPAAGSHSIGGVILHMIDAEAYWLCSVLGGQRMSEEDSRLLLSAETRQYGGKWPTPPAEPIDWYFDLQERFRRRALEAMVGVDPARKVERKDVTFTARWIVAHVVEHDSYHGGQAVVLHELYKKNRQSSKE
jgi:uncharacterized damage-inducible protein DinB